MNPYLRLVLDSNLDFNLDLWPVPVEWNAVVATMGKLTNRMEVICAVTAATMVLPLWESWQGKKFTSFKKSPKEAVDITNRWLLGKTVKLSELWSAEADARNAADNATSDRWAAYAATSAALAARAATSNTPASRAAQAVEAAAVASGAAAISKSYEYRKDHEKVVVQQFYKDWWERCKPLLVEEYKRWSDWLGGAI